MVFFEMERRTEGRAGSREGRSETPRDVQARDGGRQQWRGEAGPLLSRFSAGAGDNERTGCGGSGKATGVTGGWGLSSWEQC